MAGEHPGEAAQAAVSPLNFRGVAEATRAGFRPFRQGEYGGEQVTVKGRTLARGPSKARSRTEWQRLGFAVPDGIVPHATVNGRVGGWHQTWEVFREDQVRRVDAAERERRSASAHRAAETRRAILLKLAEDVPIRVAQLPPNFVGRPSSTSTPAVAVTPLVPGRTATRTSSGESPSTSSGTS